MPQETKSCTDCNGTGMCTICDGTGECECECPYCDNDYVRHDCSACDGSGDCLTCEGTGNEFVTDNDRESDGQLTIIPDIKQEPVI